MERVPKRQLIQLISKKMSKMIDPETGDIKLITAKDVYNLFMETLIEELLKGNDVVLTAFGTFRLQLHRGHPTPFHDNRTEHSVDSYLTLKFAPSINMTRQLHKPDKDLFEKIKNNRKDIK